VHRIAHGIQRAAIGIDDKYEGVFLFEHLL
jgi:hypothetical protein